MKFHDRGSYKATKTKITRTAQPIECTAWGMLAMTLRISRLCGMAPVSFEKTDVQEVWRIRVAPAHYIYSYPILLLLHAGVVGGLALDLSLVHAQTASDYMYSPLSRFLHVLVVVLTITITSVGVFNAVPRMTMVVQRLSAAEQIDLELSKGRRRSFTETKECVVLATSLIAAAALFIYSWYSICTGAIVAHKDMRVYYMNACLFVEFFLILVLLTLLVAIMLRMRLAFGHINAAITDLILVLDLQTMPEFSNTSVLNTDNLKTANSTGPLHSTTYTIYTIFDRLKVNTTAVLISKTTASAFRRLTRARGKISEMTRILYQSHTLLLSLIICHLFVKLIQSPYYAIVLYKTDKASLATMPAPVLTYLLFMVNLVLIVEPAHRIAREMWYTQILAGQLLRRAWGPQDPLVQEIELFMQGTLNKPYSLFGFGSLTRHFIVTILGSVTTIVVMILSFENFKP